MKHARFIAIQAAALLLLTACAQETPAPAAEPGQTPAAQSTPPTQMERPVAAADIDLSYAIVSGPTYDPASDAVSYQVAVQNAGKAGLVSAGVDPVNLGVVILDANRSLDSSPANQDFLRIPLPHALVPGEKVTVPVVFQAEPTLGGIVVLDGVQENVSWFSNYGKPVLTLGQFSRCNGARGTLCLADGTPVGSTR